MRYLLAIVAVSYNTEVPAQRVSQVRKVSSGTIVGFHLPRSVNPRRYTNNDRQTDQVTRVQG